MGVQGLWQVIEKTGRPITLDALEGKRLAVDISLWLHQAAAGYAVHRVRTRSPHLSLLINRIAKLLFYKIRPIFVFDGPNVPALKKQTLNERALRRHMDEIRLNKKQRALLEQLAKQQIGIVNPSERMAAEQQLWMKLIQQRPEDVFELPELSTAAVTRRRPNTAEFSESDEDGVVVLDNATTSTKSDDDDFVDVTDDEDTMQAILNSYKPSNGHAEECQPSTSRSASDSPSDIQIVRVVESNPPRKVSGEKVNLFQLINEQSAAKQASMNQVNTSLPATSTQLTDQAATSKKRKSAPNLPANPSPKKSAIPRVAGSGEDDWTPESVLESATNFSRFMAASRAADPVDEATENAIQADCRQLLDFLGLPYIVAPGEAEAQCVALERLGLCDGVVTDDSDAWLFGVQNCYKNMFSRRAHVEEYRVKEIRKKLGLNRTKFVAIGMLSGGDYCNGFDGVGCVTALKLINEVSDKKPPKDSDSSDESDDEVVEEDYAEGLQRLQRIRVWLDSKAKWQEKNPNKLFREPKARIRLRKTIESRNDPSRINSFPSEEVYDAYMRPDINQDAQQFEWQTVNFDELHDFLWTKIGWSPEDLKTQTHGALERWDEFLRSPILNYLQPVD